MGEKQGRGSESHTPILHLGEHVTLFQNVAKRSPLLGYNHNIGHRGLVFHVQTEDSGIDNPHIFTHLFHGGVILSSRKLEYDADADDAVVKSLMQAQHKAVLKDLKRGAFDEKIDAYLGAHPDLEPSIGDGAAAGAVTIPPPGLVAIDDEPTDPELQASAQQTLEMPQAPAQDFEGEIELATPSVRTPAPAPVLMPRTSPGPSVPGARKTSPIVRAPAPLPSNARTSGQHRVPPSATPAAAPAATPSPVRPQGQPAAPVTPVPRPNLAHAAQRAATIPGPAPAGPSVPRPPQRGTGRDNTVEIHSPAPRQQIQEDRVAPPAPASQPQAAVRPRPPGPQLPELPPRPPPAAPQAAPPSAAQRPVNSSKVLVSRPPIVVDPRKPATPTPAPAVRPPRMMTPPRTPREETEDKLFDQNLISERSLDEVILAYLSEDAGNDDT